MADALDFPRFTCPRCHQHTLLTVIFGMPSPAVGEASMRGEVLIGGCEVTDFEPSNPLRCTECEWEGALLDDGSIVSWPLFAPIDDIHRRFEHGQSEPAATFRRLIDEQRSRNCSYGLWLVVDEVRPTLLALMGESCWFDDDGEFVLGSPIEHPDLVDVGEYRGVPIVRYDEDVEEGHICALGRHMFSFSAELGGPHYVGHCPSPADVEDVFYDYVVCWNDGVKAALFGSDPADN